MRVGVVALQGGYRPHLARLEAEGLAPFEVRAPSDLERAEAVVLTGGESTAQQMLFDAAGLTAPLIAAARERPFFATCAGLILVARWGLLDVEAERNAYGAQIRSFEAISDGGRPLMFIRAPRIRRVGPGVEILDTLEGEPVLVRERFVTAAAYHPELTPAIPGDRWWTIG